jgi:LTXXQ motif family protein
VRQDWFDFASCDYYLKHRRMMPEDWKDKIGTHAAIFFGAVGWPATVPAPHLALRGSCNDADAGAALTSLHVAIAKSVAKLSEACAVATPGTPVGRLEAMHKRLEAMLSTAQEIRPALEELYGSLDGEQIPKFNRLSRVAAQSRN